MLSKILSIKGVGLLNDAKAISGEKLLKRTLIYAENGRGKSTLSAVLASCTSRNSALVSDRATLDSSQPLEIDLLFGTKMAQFRGGAWTGHQPEILIFDGNFVEQNVHAGNAVTSNQRANLLDFALGASAVQARSAAEKASEKEREEKQILKRHNSKLEGILNGRMPSLAFRELPEELDVAAKISDCEKRIDAQKKAGEIHRLRPPEPYPLVSPDFVEIARVLQLTLNKVHEEAARKVAEHIASLEASNTKEWLQHGLAIANNDDCPFCGQDTSEVELVDLYRLYFDQSYHNLQNEVAKMIDTSLAAVAPEVLAKIQSVRQQNNERIEIWRAYVQAKPLSSDNDAKALKAITDLRASLGALFETKKTNVTQVPISDGEVESLKALWSTFATFVEAENDEVKAVCDAIEAYKKTLSDADINELQTELNRLQLVSLRYDQDTVTLISDIETSEKKVGDQARAKEEAREDLNEVMDKTLGKYMDDINRHLGYFSAQFRIAEFKPDYRAKSPRVQYWLTLKGKRIALDGGVPDFSTALSDGDKRTMAFAFFAASTLRDKDLGDKIVVIDDPMSSLDASRRTRTIEVIDRISQACKQLILTAHDEHFLQEARDNLKSSDNSTEFSELTLIAAPGEYTDFATVDIDALCASQYLTHYKLVSAVVNGSASSQDDVAAAAQALRPLLEGYLYRKFPETLPRGGTLGDAITTIVGKGAPSPMYAAVAAREIELRGWNRYASQFHHDTKSDYLARARKVTRAEVCTYGKEIFEFIHSA